MPWSAESSRTATRASLSRSYNSLLSVDDYMLLADYQSYIDCQERVSAVYKDQEAWTRMSIFNVTRIGKFSSDRSIRDYCAEIWKAWPTKIQI